MRPDRLRRSAMVVGIGLLATVIAGCGFRLAGTAELPQQLQRLQLQLTGFSNEAEEDIRQRLQNAGATIVGSSFADAPRLSVSLSELTERTLFESSDQQQTRRLTQQLTFSVRSSDGDPLLEPRRLRQQEDLEVDIANLLSSAREREELQSQMLQQLISRMIYQLQLVTSGS